MSNILQEYKAYYKVREERFANNPNYSNSYEAEKKLSNAMQACQKLEEFRTKLGNLPDQCAFALMKDEYLMEQKHYEEHQEPHRQVASNEVLKQLPNCKTVQDAITLSLDAQKKANDAIISDEYQREFVYAWSQLDDIEVYSKAVVPNQYQSEMEKSVKEMKTKMQANARYNETEFRKFIPNWSEKPETCLEHRHRRLLPYKDEHVKEQLATYQNIIKS